MTGAVHVFLAALATALATGLGALPLLIRGRPSRGWLGFGNAAAAGLMLGASLGLIAEGGALDPARTLAGVVLTVVGRRSIERRSGGLGVADLRGADASKALLLIAVLTAHSAAEGVGVGVAFGGGEGMGPFIAAAIAVHNVPEGLAVALALVPRGVPVGRAALWAVVTSLPQPLLAVPAFLWVVAFQAWLPAGLGLAAGAMIWVALADLLPEALAEASDRRVAPPPWRSPPCSPSSGSCRTEAAGTVEGRRTKP